MTDLHFIYYYLLLMVSWQVTYRQYIISKKYRTLQLEKIIKKLKHSPDYVQYSWIIASS